MCAYAKIQTHISFAVSASQYQLCGNSKADQRLCFHYRDSTIPLLSILNQNLQPLAIFSSCTALFESDLVRNHNVGFLMSQLMYIEIKRNVKKGRKSLKRGQLT